MLFNWLNMSINQTKISFLSEGAIDDYINVYKEELGKEISFENARIQAENLLKLIKLVATSST